MDLNLYKDYDHEHKLERDIYFTIDHNGIWYYHGEQNPGPMKRETLVKLFADKALKKIEDKYFLKTPFEEYEVEVEDVPFLITSYRAEDDDVILVNNIGNEIVLSEEHQIFLSIPKFVDIHLPYIKMENDLVARLHQDVRNDFINKALEANSDLQENDTLHFIVKGVNHPIAIWEE